MGIDIYARWHGQTEAEKNAQYTGFSIVHGHVGYLREAYHGPPYATQALLPEAFAHEEADNDDDGDTGCPIPAATLRERLPKVLETVAIRYARSSEDLITKAQKSYSDFVELCERKEKELGEPVRIIVSG